MNIYLIIGFVVIGIAMFGYPAYMWISSMFSVIYDLIHGESPYDVDMFLGGLIIIGLIVGVGFLIYGCRI